MKSLFLTEPKDILLNESQNINEKSINESTSDLKDSLEKIKKPENPNQA